MAVAREDVARRLTDERESATDASAVRARSRAVFNIEGMHCSNCSRAVERAVRALEGVQRVTVNVATAQAAVEWNPDRFGLSRIFDAVEAAGFKPVPLEGEAAVAAERSERRTALKRIGIAGLGMMQTMMFVYALYAGGNHGVNAQIAQYLRLAGMLLTTPVLVYSGAPFFTAAIRDLRQRRLGMDVPVAAALVLAFVASVVNTLKGSGQVYYDSVTMFIFLLSLGRFAEMIVRQRSLTASEAFARAVPTTVVKVCPDGRTERVPLSSIHRGDRLRVARGAVIPVDGNLASMRALIDESLITGESRPVGKAGGDAVLGGSINTRDPIEILCAGPSESSTLAGIVALLRRAGAERPRAVAAADRAASAFSLVTVILAGSVALYWAVVDPGYVMTATLAVLVVTCPCALSLATPATFAAVTARLARLGLLVVKPDAIERLARVDAVVLDKTGTLTEGNHTARIEGIKAGYSADTALAIAAALERASDHPLAQAFEYCADPGTQARDIREFVGRGVEGSVAAEVWRLGRADFVEELGPGAATLRESGIAEEVASVLTLGTREGIVATIRVQDKVAQEAKEAVALLLRQGLRVAIASGDCESAVRAAATELGITECHARMTFNSKLDLVRRRQAAGEHVLMVGDGINDGPVLAAADVSCALTDGSAVAQSAADLLLLNRSLRVLGQAVILARRARRIVQQNLTWALIYNVTMVPLAAAGCIAPWVAALGMSISSMAVVLNSARLAAAEPAAVARRAK
jgi:Cu2+-exporting ATPase